MIRFKELKHKRLNLCVMFVFVFTLVGYPVQASVPTFFSIDSTLFNASIRALITLVACFVIISELSKGKFVFNRYIAFFLLFWIFYCGRLFVDLNLKGIRYDYERYTPFFIYSMAIGGCIIPSLAVFISIRRINLVYLYKWLYVVSFLGNILMLLLVIFQYDVTSLMNMFYGRMVLYGQEEASGGVINPISISFYGSILFLLSLINLFLSKRLRAHGFASKFWMNIIGICLGLTNLLAGASRGPFISTILLVIFLVFLVINISNRRYRFFVISIIVLISGVFLFLLMGGDTLFNNISVLKRLGFVGQSDLLGSVNDSNLRLALFSSAWEQFMAHPVIGDKIIVTGYKIYPHNLILEILMSMGVIGIGMAFVSFQRALSNARLAIKRNYLIAIPFIISFGSFFLLSLTSFNLFTNPGLWVSLALLISLGRNYKKRQVMPASN